MRIKDIEIIMLPAKSGDCILINFIKEQFRILIDGGYKCTYDQYLKPYLLGMSKKGAHLNLVIATHIDRDHINGIRGLLEENGDNSNPQIIKIDEIWFNGFRNMPIAKEPADVTIPPNEQNHLRNMASNLVESINNGSYDISYSDGNSLADLIVKNNYIWNEPFSKAVSEDDRSDIDYGKIHIHILNPTMKELDHLAQKWIGELKKKTKKIVISDNHLFEGAFEGCFIFDNEYESHNEKISSNMDVEIDWMKEAANDDDLPDNTVPNLSSIVLLIEYEGMTLLFTGDCPMYKIKDKIPDKINVVKLAHHGSGKSNDKSFIRNNEVDYYLLSTDGKKGHPSKTIIGNILYHSRGDALIVSNYYIPMLKGISYIDEVISNDEFD